MDQILNEMNQSQENGRKPRKSYQALSEAQFFSQVISVWGLEETQLRQSIYFSFVASEV